MNIFWNIAYFVLAALFVVTFAYLGVFLHKATTEDLPDQGGRKVNNEDQTVSEFYNKLPEEKKETITAFVKAAISKQDKIDSRYIECFKTKFTDEEKDITYYLVGSAIEKEWSEVKDNEERQN